MFSLNHVGAFAIAAVRAPAFGTLFALRGFLWGSFAQEVHTVLFTLGHDLWYVFCCLSLILFVLSLRVLV